MRLLKCCTYVNGHTNCKLFLVHWCTLIDEYACYIHGNPLGLLRLSCAYVNGDADYNIM